MKAIVLILVSLLLISCKQQTQQEPQAIKDSVAQDSITTSLTSDSTYFDHAKLQEEQAKSQLLKKEGLSIVSKEIPALKNLVTSKNIFKEGDDYELDYTYPYLNEKINAGYKKFNDYMTQTYLNTELTINEILEDNEMICDTLSIPRYRDKRIIDYKLYHSNDDLISILIYKENYYSGMTHSTYMFETVNYDLQHQEFINFENYFIAGSEEMVFNIINKTITDQMNTGEMYYDCWQMTLEDFMIYKNNFVFTGEEIAFYLDDCIICPSHTGEYKVVIPIAELMSFIQKKNSSLL